jgi:hypothetical protein
VETVTTTGSTHKTLVSAPPNPLISLKAVLFPDPPLETSRKQAGNRKWKQTETS